MKPDAGVEARLGSQMLDVRDRSRESGSGEDNGASVSSSAV